MGDKLGTVSASIVSCVIYAQVYPKAKHIVLYVLVPVSRLVHTIVRARALALLCCRRLAVGRYRRSALCIDSTATYLFEVGQVKVVSQVGYDIPFRNLRNLIFWNSQAAPHDHVQLSGGLSPPATLLLHTPTYIPCLPPESVAR